MESGIDLQLLHRLLRVQDLGFRVLGFGFWVLESGIDLQLLHRLVPIHPCLANRAVKHIRPQLLLSLEMFLVPGPQVRLPLRLLVYIAKPRRIDLHGSSDRLGHPRVACGLFPNRGFRV